ncbi:MAG: YbaB/EbfC family nucleoid-associated protein [Planctomycetota bacterium]|nr:MAG: YbaB/EbfC family nucleoid-associated protein [Planctomycetota bacterium]
MDIGSLMASMGPIQERMKQQEAERAAAVIEGRAGGGAVSISLSGALEVKKVSIAPAAAAAASDDASMLEDLIHSALADALRQHQARFGGSPEEQLQKSLAGADLSSLLGGLMGGFGR